MNHFCRLAVILVAAGCLCSGPAAVAQTNPPVPVVNPTAGFKTEREPIVIPFEIELNKILIPVKVNGSRPLRFVLDTGWLAPAINNPAAAAELNLRSSNKTDVGGAGNGPRLQAGIVPDASFDISGFQIEHQILLLPPETAARPRLGTWDGIIGTDIFTNAVVEIDSERRQIKLYKPENYKYAGRGEIIPITVNDRGIPLINTEIDINGNSTSVKLIVDTGFGSALSLSVSSIKGARVPAGSIETVAGFGASGRLTGYVGRTPGINLGKYRFDNLLTQFPDDASGAVVTQLGANGLIGAEITRRFKVIFDYSRSRMILEPNRFFKDRFEYAMTGIVFAPRAGDASLKVLDVLKDSPAQRAGVEIGDEVTAINKKAVSAYSEDELFNLYRREKKTLLLTVKRNEQIIEKKLKTERLV